MRGDLDWIVMKCLEKDRARRYETANGLAADLNRHLNDEPVVARPPSRLYEFQKTVRRHKVGFAATAAQLAFNIRLLQSPPFGEWSEGFAAGQVGSHTAELLLARGANPDLADEAGLPRPKRSPRPPRSAG